MFPARAATLALTALAVACAATTLDVARPAAVHVARQGTVCQAHPSRRPPRRRVGPRAAPAGERCATTAVAAAALSVAASPTPRADPAQSAADVATVCGRLVRADRLLLDLRGAQWVPEVVVHPDESPEVRVRPDVDGQFSVAVPAGFTSVRVVVGESVLLHEWHTAKKAQILALGEIVVPELDRLRGRVVDAAGAAVADAVVTPVDADDNPIAGAAASDDDGAWTLHCVPRRADLHLRVAADGFGTVRRALPPSDEVIPDLVLRDAAALVVLCPEDWSYPSCSVRDVSTGTWRDVPAVDVASDGGWLLSLGDVDPGELEVEAHDWFASYGPVERHAVTVAPGGAAVVRVER
jgi:hypothetical protein